MNSLLNSPRTNFDQLKHHFRRIRQARREARDDPNVFISYCFTDPLGHCIQQAPIHAELQAFLSRHPRALIELPRDHGKSFQVCCRIVWELGRNVELRVKVVCATGAIAGERARFIREAIENNKRVRLVFPELQPGKPWGAASFAVARSGDAIGPSVTAYGVGAGSTGTRADLLVCDDVVDVRSLHNCSERDRVGEHFHDNLMNLLEPEGRFWGLFTPWHGDDLNARLKKNPVYTLFRRAIGPNFEPVWESKWPAQRLRERKAEIGSVSFARGYHLRPIAEEDTPIRPEWVRFWLEPADCDMVVLSVDPAVSTRAGADASALVVLGRTATSHKFEIRNPKSEMRTPSAASDSDFELRISNFSQTEVRVLAATARRVPAPELVSLIDALDQQWNPAVILFESNAAFLGIKDLLVRHARFGPRVKGVTQSADKAARVAAFSVAVENGSFRLKGNAAGSVDVGQRELFDEMTTFPCGEHDDLLDAAATGCAYLLDRREPRVW
jgi:predicted phage terminase large subunit-like protein